MDHTAHYTLDVERGIPEGHEVVFEGEGDENPDWEPGDVVLRVPAISGCKPDLLLQSEASKQYIDAAIRFSCGGVNDWLLHLASTNDEVKDAPIPGWPVMTVPAEKSHVASTIRVYMSLYSCRTYIAPRVAEVGPRAFCTCCCRTTMISEIALELPL